ncbi:MAG: hypothetical protein F6K42_26530 [Leptolyngbya sp. SIO1D8]|nr:hypothetical protein [Leptolyngbya sp. SIO1D8]
MDRLSLGHPALDCALSLLAQATPQEAKRAITALQTLLQGVTHSAWPEVAWQFSTLTGDGFPVEFAFTTADASIRYTTEVAGPEVPPSDRLALAQQRLADLGALPLPFPIHDRLHRIQTTGRLHYGTWVGGRHSAAGDRYKLYIEVPSTLTLPALKQLVPEWADDNLLPHRSISLRMIGYELATHRVERYYRVAGLDDWEIQRLRHQIQLSDAVAPWQALLKSRLSSALSGSNAGFSLSQIGQDKPTLSLFTFARSLFGGDRQIRHHLLQLAAQQNWNLSAYETLSRPLTNQTDCNTAHGMVTFVIAPTPVSVLGIGLRPHGQKGSSHTS